MPSVYRWPRWSSGLGRSATRFRILGSAKLFFSFFRFFYELTSAFSCSGVCELFSVVCFWKTSTGHALWAMALTSPPSLFAMISYFVSPGLCALNLSCLCALKFKEIVAFKGPSSITLHSHGITYARLFLLCYTTGLWLVHFWEMMSGLYHVSENTCARYCTTLYTTLFFTPPPRSLSGFHVFYFISTDLRFGSIDLDVVRCF